MKICANILCEKVFETNYDNKIYCSSICQRIVNNKIASIKLMSELSSTQIIQQIIAKIKLERIILRFVNIYKNSSIDAIRQLIDLPPLEIKEANRYIDLIEY